MIDTGKQVIDTWNGIHCILACTVRMMMMIIACIAIAIVVVIHVIHVMAHVVNGRSMMMMMCGVSRCSIRIRIRCIGGMRSEDGSGTIIGGWNWHVGRRDGCMVLVLLLLLM